MTLTLDDLRGERENLTKQLEASKAQLAAITGALQMTDHLIAKLEAPKVLAQPPVEGDPSVKLSRSQRRRLAVQGVNGNLPSTGVGNEPGV